jgi:hypothetical protein
MCFPIETDVTLLVCAKSVSPIFSIEIADRSFLLWPESGRELPN